MTIDDVVINKVSTLERCLKRIREEYAECEANLTQNQTKQDSIILNLQRACEVSIDLGMYLVSKLNLKVPQSSRDTFDILEEANIISPELALRLKNMVSFRNIAVHQYQKLDLQIVKSVIEINLQDFELFMGVVKKL